MKKNVLISILVGFFLLIALGVILSGRPGHDPKDLAYWVRVGGDKDWSEEAAGGNPEAQFLFGLALIRTNLTKFVGRVPILSKVPVLGKRFEDISYSIDSGIAPEQLSEAHQWIKKSANQGYAPAKEAEKLFAGRVAAPTNDRPANGSQPIPSETNRASSAAGSRR